MRRLVSMMFVVLAAAGLAPRALAARDPFMRPVAGPGWTVPSADGGIASERVSLDPEVVAYLLDAKIEETVFLADWPVARGIRTNIRLVRHEVYAADAVVWKVEGDRLSELPRSEHLFFWGETEDEDQSRIAVVVDPERRTLEAYLRSEEGWEELRPDPGSSGEYVLSPSRGSIDDGEGRLQYACGQESLPETVGMAPSSEDEGAPATESVLVTTLHRVTIAVDTDNELMSLKFSDSTTAATNYLASLFALTSAIYERDLNVRWLQGTTFLRVSSTADPYTVSDTGNASNAKLTEFRTYWTSNHGGVSRALAMMLSGKQGSPTSSSGIAYVARLCSSSFGYSFTQVFKFAGSTASNDVFVVGHENGHNFGSRHTHCYLTPTPIDTCYNLESGCWSGATSCPAPQTINGVPNVRGTIMSYCHTLGGCSASSVFHPRTVDIIEPYIDDAVGVCVFPVPNPKEASPSGNLRASRAGGSSVNVTYTPACGATNHVVYGGNLSTLRPGGIVWSQRHCNLGTSGSLTFTPSGNAVYFVVVGNNGTKEGSYGRRSSGPERPPAGAGGACSYTQDLSGSCP